MFSSLYQVCCGVRTRVLRGSRVLNASHVDQLESALPTTHQCYDWRLLYRLSRDGARYIPLSPLSPAELSPHLCCSL